uniref:Uncharacterized protein n=1 Tax=Arundo donax TaxID=35708 RepID=A0A0A9CG94_ARUDO
MVKALPSQLLVMFIALAYCCLRCL